MDDNNEQKDSELESSESESPESVAPEVESPEAEVPEAEVPEEKTPEAESPEAESPEVEAPLAGVPEAEVPEAETPEAESPEAESLEADAPLVGVPEAGAPEAEVPEAEVPEADAPEADAPEAEAPEAESPEADASEAGAPLAGVPEAETPEASEEEVAGATPSNKKSRKGLIASLILLLFLIIGISAIYVYGVFYFQERFFFNTKVNGVDFSRQTPADAREFVESKANDYYITIIGVDGEEERIYASEVNLRFEASDVIEELFEAQDPYRWPLSLMDMQETEAGFESFFDEELLEERVSNLEIVVEGQKSPVSADVVMEGNEVVIVPHEYGNVVNVRLLNDLLQEYVSVLADEFNAVGANIFIQPELTTESPEIIEAFEAANNYLSAVITYNVGSDVVVDRDLISEWVTVEDLNVHFDEEQVGIWLDDFVSTINTFGTTRSLTTPNGRNVTVTGGYYGWIVSRDLEYYELLENIRNGEVIEREPIYHQRAASHGEHDWGNTFLQVDLSEQHMWAFINGEMVFESPVVTGRPDFDTPPGVYFILEMLSPNVLISPWLDDDGEPTYETHVYYWMRTTWSGHGFHDAPWQDEFGGDRYLEYGSHGCTNLPLEAARELYGIVFHMMPVVVHH